MPEDNEALLDLISQSIRVKKPNLTEDQFKTLALNVKNIFESLNGGVMQLEDATQSVVSYCLDLLIKTESLSKSNNKLLSSYDLIVEKIDSIVSSITTRTREVDILARQTFEIQNIISQGSNYLFKLPDKFVRSMENLFERSNVLISNSISQSMLKAVDKIVNSFKIVETFLQDPFKVTKNNLFEREDEDNNFLSFNKKDLINEKTLAGITDIPLNEQLVLYKSAPGIAVMWLAKRLEKSGLTVAQADEGGFISKTKDNLLQGMGIAGGMSMGVLFSKMLTLILNPWVLASVAVALGGALVWKFREPINEFLNRVGESAVEWLENTKTAVKAKYEEIKGMIVDTWESGMEKLNSGWQWTVDRWNSIQSTFSEAVNSVGNFWRGVAEKALAVYDETVLPLLKDIDSLFGGVFSAGIEEIKKLKPYLDDFTSWVADFRDSIQNFILSSGSKFLNWLKDIKNAVAPKDLRPGGFMGAPAGRDARELIDQYSYKPNLNRTVTEETALRITYDVLKEVEAGNRYDMVNRNDSGAVSLGTLQWNANRARDYLKRLYEVDPSKFRDVMGSKVVSDLEDSNWSNRKFSLVESQSFTRLMEDPRMRAETDRLAMDDISKYFKFARGLGIEDYRSLSLAASMINQYGPTGFRNLLENRLGTTDFDEMVQLFQKDRYFPYRDRRLTEVERLNDLYKDIKILKEDISKSINIPEVLESYQQTANALVVNEVKAGLEGISESFTKSINELKTEVKETRRKDDSRGMEDSGSPQVSRDYINDIPRYIMEMIFGLNIGGEDKKFGGIF